MKETKTLASLGSIPVSPHTLCMILAAVDRNHQSRAQRPIIGSITTCITAGYCLCLLKFVSLVHTQGQPVYSRNTAVYIFAFGGWFQEEELVIKGRLSMMLKCRSLVKALLK